MFIGVDPSVVGQPDTAAEIANLIVGFGGMVEFDYYRDWNCSNLYRKRRVVCLPKQHR
jgi:hypothetical protein